MLTAYVQLVLGRFSRSFPYVRSVYTLISVRSNPALSVLSLWRLVVPVNLGLSIIGSFSQILSKLCQQEQCLFEPWVLAKI